MTPIYGCTWSDLDWYHYLRLWEQLSPDMKRVAELVGVQERFLARAVRGRIPSKTAQQARTVAVHRRFYTALLLQDLICEMSLPDAAAKYKCNRGMLQSLQQSAATFAGQSPATAVSSQPLHSQVSYSYSHCSSRRQHSQVSYSYSQCSSRRQHSQVSYSYSQCSSRQLHSQVSYSHSYSSQPLHSQVSYSYSHCSSRRQHSQVSYSHSYSSQPLHSQVSYSYSHCSSRRQHSQVSYSYSQCSSRRQHSQVSYSYSQCSSRRQHSQVSYRWKRHDEVGNGARRRQYGYLL